MARLQGREKRDNGQRAAADKGQTFEGGQLPLTRRIPKGVSKIRSERNTPWSRYPIWRSSKERKGSASIEDILESGTLNQVERRRETAFHGEIDFPIKIQVHKASQKAIEKYRPQGGEVEVLV